MEYVYRRSTLSINMSTAAIECLQIGLQKMYIVIKYVYRGYRVSWNMSTEEVHCHQICLQRL